ncbi:MAG: alanine dehydrogenase [Verrucomicrobia bacterium]|nr:alanine dehydrogenase [Verrucomicrobiota bacterium]
MVVGVPKEVKDSEYRVGATPAVVKMLVDAGHKVLVESKAGSQIGYSDAMYAAAGAHIATHAADVYQADMVVKVKEPQPSEYGLLRKGQLLFAYLHLAPDPQLTQALIDAGVVAIAYETVTDAEGRLPLLTPMSEIAGKISIQAGATALQIANGGKGVLLGGVPGVTPGKVIVIGAGAAGTEAARVAVGFGADVTVLDTNLSRIRALDALYGPRLKTLVSHSAALDELLPTADLVIGAVLIPGKLAPRLITREHLKMMTPGTVIVDISIDQGGCCETSRPTSHSEPTYLVDGICHYCVTNMPGACARTATEALNNATMRYTLLLANRGYKDALREDKGLRTGLNVCNGQVTHESVAHDLSYDYHPPEEMI